MDITRTFDLLNQYATKYRHKKTALAGKHEGKWVHYSAEEYVENANDASYGLFSLGLREGDLVATITNNRPEWNFIDMGLAQAGMIHVPLFTNLSAENYADTLNHAEVKAVFVSDKKLFETIQSLKNKVQSLDHVFTFDNVTGARHWKEIIKAGRKHRSKFASKVESIKASTSPTDPVTLIYTSGTTGTSKGVLLSHQNLVSNAKSCAKVFQLKQDERYLSILPICHVGERTGNYQTQFSGCSIFYAENLATIAKDLQKIKPHGFGAVPRILERVYDKILSKGDKLKGMKRKLFFWALDLGLKYDPGKGYWYKLQLAVARKLIFKKWQEALGGNIKVVGIGGAALQPRLEKVFWAAGIRLINMYGLTETSPTITMNRNGGPQFKLGTVGAPIDNVEVKIAEDGEIMCKGPNIMLGYFKDEAATDAVMKDGWFCTGDVGEFKNGFLQVTDRKKEVFKLSNGKYVAPLAIENILKESVYVDQAMVIGEGEKFTSALISPNFEMLEDWAGKNHVATSHKSELIANKKIHGLFQEIINKYNDRLGKDEKIKRFRLVPGEWSTNTGELSPTLKLKRRVLRKKYGDLIAEIFGHPVNHH